MYLTPVFKYLNCLAFAHKYDKIVTGIYVKNFSDYANNVVTGSFSTRMSWYL